VENDARMQAHDNLDFQLITRDLYIVEDYAFGEIWAAFRTAPIATSRVIDVSRC
jgi:hypothetical protein